MHKIVWQKIRRFWEKFFLLNDTPHKIAAGFATGIFLGVLPGEGVAATLVAVSLLGFNRLSATAGALLFNVWSTILLLPPAAGIGGWIFDKSPALLIEQFQQARTLGWAFFHSKFVLFSIALPLLVGFLVLAAVLAAAGYLALHFSLSKGKLRFRREA